MLVSQRRAAIDPMSKRLGVFAGPSLRVLLMFSIAVQPLGPVFAQSVPNGGRVTAGSATIAQPSASSVIINQGSARAVIDWNSFSVGQSNSVTFNQPDRSSATLNRVTGDTPSSIAGSVSANGQVYLVNPNGIAITKSGTVNVGGGFVGSTLGIDNADFMNGKLQFKGKGASAGVSNEGTVSAAPGGFAGFFGGWASNGGTVIVPLGKVGIGSGERATLDLNGNGFLQVAVPTGAKTPDGKALVDAGGKIRADGGTVELKAATVRQAIRDVVNVSGIVSAHSVAGRNGSIVLDGGAGGRVAVSGKLTTSGKKKGKSPVGGGNIAVTGAEVAISGKIDASGKAGGRIDITGNTVGLAGATIDAGGEQQGGLVRIGGAFQGGKWSSTPPQDLWEYVGRFGNVPVLAAAGSTSVDAATKINVSAKGSAGLGGTVVVWSSVATDMRGTIDASGDAKGGAVEISSKGRIANLDLAKLSIGAGGKLLLDPKDIFVGNYLPGDPAGSYLYDGSATTTFISNQAISDLLVAQGLDVRLQASNNITWSGSLGFSSSGTFAAKYGTLTLEAGNNITISSANFSLNHNGSGTDGNLVIVANDANAIGPRDTGLASINLNNAKIDLGTAGSATITMSNGAGGGNISLGTIKAGAVAATQNSGGKIVFGGNVTTTGAQTYTGPLSFVPLAGNLITLTSDGSTINWTDEAASSITGSADFNSTVKFMESGKLTRFGILDLNPNADATRLGLAAAGSGYTRVYGDADSTISPALAPTLKLVRGTLIGSDTLSSIAAAGSLQIVGPGVTAQAGTANATVSTTTPTGFSFATSNAGYFIDLRDAQAPVTITPRLLSYSVNAAQYTYGSPSPVVTLGNIANADNVVPTGTLSGVAGSMNLVGNGGGTSFALAANAPAGTRTFTLTGLSGSAASNYTLTLGASISAPVTIDPKTLTYSCCNATSTYGSTPPALSVTLSGILAGDDVSAAGVQALKGSVASGTPVAVNVRTPAGTYAIAATGLAGTAATNYVLATDGATNPTFTVAPKQIGYTTSAFGSEYGSAPPTVALMGILTGDTVSGSLEATPYANGFATGPAAPYTAYTRVGSYKVAATLSGPDAANYVVSSALTPPATIAIQPKTITASITDLSVIYGNGAVPVSILGGVLPGDNVSGQVTVSKGATTLGANLPANSWVGTYSALTTGLAGNDAGNYYLAGVASASNLPGTITVTPRPVTYSVANGAATYGDSHVMPTATINGILAADQAQIASTVTMTNAAGQTVTPAPTLGAGSYTNRVTALSSYGVPGLSDNYVLDHTNSIAGRYDIAKKTLTYSLVDLNGTYGSDIKLTDTASSTNGKLLGLVNGEKAEPIASVLTTLPSVITSQVAPGVAVVSAGAPAGSYRYGVTGIQAIGGTGFDPANYTLQPSAAANLTIAPKTLTYSLGAETSVYGTLANPQATLSGVFGSDDVTGTVRISYGGLVYPLTAKSAALAYSTSVSGLTGTSAGNYVLASTGNTDGSLTITPKLLYWNVGAAAGTYGTQATPGAATLIGVLAGDDVRGDVGVKSGGSALSLTPLTPAGSYDQYVSQLYGSQAMNYAVSPIGMGLSYPLTINPRPLTIQIGNGVRQYGEVNPTIGYNYVSGSLVSGDQANIFTYATAQQTSNVGSYATYGSASITSPSGPTLNYQVTLLPGTLIVKPLQVNYAVSSTTDRIYGTPGSYPSTATFKAATANVDSVFLNPAYTTSAVDAAGQPVTLDSRTPAGTYAIKPAVADPNYQVVGGINGTLVVNPRPLILGNLTIPGVTYGTMPTGIWSSGVLAGDDVGARIDSFKAGATTHTSATYWKPDGTSISGSPPSVGQYDATGLTLTGAAMANYKFDNAIFATSAVKFDIVPRPITITGYAPASLVYGTASDPYFNGTVSYSGLVSPYDYLQLSPRMSPIAAGTNAGKYNWYADPAYALGGRDPNTLAPKECLTAGCMNMNYVLAPTGNVPAPLTITPKQLTAGYGANNQTSTEYGQTAALMVTLDGVLAKDLGNVAPVIGFADNLAVVQRAGTTNVGTDPNQPGRSIYAGLYNRIPVLGDVWLGTKWQNIKSYTVGVDGLMGTAAGNYTVNPLALNPSGSLKVTPRTMAYSTGGPFTTYYGIGSIGDSMTGFGSYAFKGVLAGDQLNVTGMEVRQQLTAADGTTYLSASGTPIQSMTSTKPGAGTYSVVVTGIGGASAGNYVLSTNGNAPGTLTVISPKEIVDQLTLLGTDVQTSIVNNLTNPAPAAGSTDGRSPVSPGWTDGIPTVQPVNPVRGSLLDPIAPPTTVVTDQKPLAPPTVAVTPTPQPVLPDPSKKVGAGTGQSTGTSGTALGGMVSGNASASQGVSATAGVGIEGATAKAGANQNAQATGCIGSVCETVGVNADANVSVLITPVYGKVKAGVEAGVSETTTVTLTCGGSPCTITNTLSVDISADVSASYSLTGGITQKAMISGGITDNVNWSGSCGDAKCSADLGATVGFLEGVSNKAKFQNGLEFGENATFGANVGVHAGYEVSSGGFGAGVQAGVTTGSFALGSDFGATFENGHLKLDIGTTIGIGIAGFSIDLKVDLDVGAIERGLGTVVNALFHEEPTVYVQQYVDPIAAQQRLDAEADLRDRLAALRQEQVQFLKDSFSGKISGSEINRRATALRERTDVLLDNAHRADLDFKVSAGGQITIHDRKPPAMEIVKEQDSRAYKKQELIKSLEFELWLLQKSNAQPERQAKIQDQIQTLKDLKVDPSTNELENGALMSGSTYPF